MLPAAVPARFRPVAVSAAVFAAAALAVEFAIWPQTGALFYPLDDTYIQMAIARNLTSHGTWGIAGEFANAGSSLLWPLMLASTYLLAGVNAWSPLVLNALAAIAVLLAANHALKPMLGPGHRTIALIVLVLALPLFQIYRIGMEHTLACAVVIASVAAVVRAGESDRPVAWPVLALGALLVSVRFDLGAVAVPLAMVLVRKKGWREGAWFAAIAAVPVAVSALNAARHGWPLLPAPVLVKNALATVGPSSEGIVRFFTEAATRTVSTPVLPAILLLCAAMLLLGKVHRQRSDVRSLQAVAMAAIVIHLCFGRTGWQFRYEVHLMALGLVAIAADLPAALPSLARSQRWLVIVLAVALALSLMWRGHASTTRLIEGVAGLQRYDYLRGEFFQRHPPERGLVIGAIGIIGYLTDVPMIDPAGLLTPALIPFARHDIVDLAAVHRIANDQGADISLFALEGWPCVGEWVIDGTPERLYAIDDDVARRVAAGWNDFAAERGVPLRLGAAGCDTEVGDGSSKALPGRWKN
jgi:hypothetical protein